MTTNKTKNKVINMVAVFDCDEEVEVPLNKIKKIAITKNKIITDIYINTSGVLNFGNTFCELFVLVWLIYIIEDLKWDKIL